MTDTSSRRVALPRDIVGGLLAGDAMASVRAADELIRVQLGE